MARLQLTLDALKDLDYGKVSAQWAHDLEWVIRDCIERPADSKPRKVILEMTCVPEHDGVDCIAVDAQFKVKSSIPIRQSRNYRLGVTKHGQLFFQEDAPDNPNQLTMLDADPA